MHATVVLGILGRLIMLLSLAMLVPVGIAWGYHETDVIPLLKSVGVTFVVGLMTSLLFRLPQQKDMSHREGILIVSFGWLSAGLFGSLPYLFTKTFGPLSWASFVNSFFESISGFTTTGASVLGTMQMIESLSHGLLFWRSFTQWLGGLGIIVLAIAILPLLGIGGMQLYKAEAGGPTKEKIKPRVRQIAMTSWAVYLILTFVQTLLLYLGGMNLFDAFCHTFSTLSSGGFSTKTDSIGYFSSPFIQWVLIVFMILATTNFSSHYLAWPTRLRSYWINFEFRYYLAIIFVATCIASVSLYYGKYYENVHQAILKGAFQVVSIISTTGYSTADYQQWPLGLQFTFFFLMFFGGCAGSTTGGIKIIRTVLLAKYAYREIFRLVHPKAFVAVKFGQQVIQKEVLQSISGFFILYMGMFVIASIILTSLGLGIVTAFTSVAACMGNIGPGLGTVGPASNFFHLPIIGKMILIFCMVLGRLEIYTFLAIFIPAFWKK